MVKGRGPEEESVYMCDAMGKRCSSLYYCVSKKQISNFQVDEISTPSDRCSVSTSIVCDSDTIL